MADKTVNQRIKTGGFRMSSQDIRTWKRAIDSARHATNPRRKLLYDLYENILIDGHLKAVKKKREIAITNKEIHFYKLDGSIDEYVQSEVIDSPWFYNMLKHMMGAISFGHSLIELETEGGIITKSTLLPRENVVPEKGFLMFDPKNPESGIYYRDEPSFKDYLIEVGEPNDYGLLMTVAQYVIYKRGGFGDWAQFAEIFGQPFRVGKYNLHDNDVRNKLEQSLEEMGASPYAVIPDGAEIEFHANNGTGKSETFENLIRICKEEISLTYLGNTMTTENGSSKSQSETHKEVEEELNAADIIEIQNILNWEIIEKLRKIGYKIPPGKFKINTEKELPLEERILIDVKVSEKVFIPDSYWYETYGIPKPTAQDIADMKKKLAKDAEAASKAAEKKKTNPRQVAALHNHYYNAAHSAFDHTFVMSDSDEDLLNDLFNKRSGKYLPQEMIEENEKLAAGVRKSFPVSIGYMEPDYIAGVMMEMNINRFGFNKSFSKVIELNKALDISKGYADFKKKAFLILDEFDGHLETEYNLAIASAQNARDWIKFKSEKDDYPYLQYKTVADDAVRASHEALHNKVFSLDKTDWRAIYPPNGYGCRCEMIQLRKDQVKSSDVISGAEAKGLLGDDWELMKKGGFDKNRGETLDIFDLNKSYLKSFKGDIEKTISQLTYEDAGLSTISEIRAAKKLPELKRYSDTPDSIKKRFDKNKVTVGEKDFNVFKDYTGREVVLSKSDLDKHLTEKYITSAEERHSIFKNVSKVLKNPDEVYLTTSSSGTIGQYRYIKFYKDDVLVIEVKVSKKAGLEMKTWYKMKADEKNIRRGILVK